MGSPSNHLRTRRMTLHFLFAQFEFTHAVGPYAGRYVVGPQRPTPGVVPDGIPVGAGAHDAETAVEARNRDVAGVTRGIGDSDVLVIGVRGTPVKAQRGVLRRARVAAAEDDRKPSSVPISVVTFIAATDPLPSATDASRRLDEIRFSDAEQSHWVRRGLNALNLAVRAYRLRAPDPYAIEVTRRDARLVLIGYGTTMEVQNGRYTTAIEVPPTPTGRRSRFERLRPEEAVASVLAGYQPLFEAEDVLSRSLIDLDNGRTRAAAVQTAAGMQLLRDEVFGLEDPHQVDTAKLAEHSRVAHALAAAATLGQLTSDQIAQLEAVVDGVGEILDTWRTTAAGRPLSVGGHMLPERRIVGADRPT